MTGYRRLGGTAYAVFPLDEWLALWADVAEHNRKAMEYATKRHGKPQDRGDGSGRLKTRPKSS